jgi:hypothetical protein
MKDIHIASRETYLKHGLNFRNSQFLDLPSGQVIITGDIDDTPRKDFELEQDVIPLPFILDGQSISARAASALSSHGVTMKDTTMSVLLKLRKVHAAFNPTQF